MFGGEGSDEITLGVGQGAIVVRAEGRYHLLRLLLERVYKTVKTINLLVLVFTVTAAAFTVALALAVAVTTVAVTVAVTSPERHDTFLQVLQ